MITDPSEQNLQSMCLTKNKRDEFLVEIRKKKSQMILLQKRIKMFGSPTDQQSTTMQEEIFGYANQDSQNSSGAPLELSTEVTGTFSCINSHIFKGKSQIKGRT